MTPNFKADLRHNGFVIIPNVFSVEQLDKIGRAIQLHADYYSSENLLDTDWHAPEFHAALIQLRKTNPDVTARLYDTLQTNAVLRQICVAPKVVELAAEALDVDPSGLSATGEMIRLDYPEDTRNALKWHQERSYYPQNRDGRNGLVTWAPLEGAGSWNGSIEVCPGSHRDGLIAINSSGKTDYVTSEQYQVPEDRVSDFEAICVDAPKGSIVLFDMHLFHRSGYNGSDRIRCSLGTRFHKTLSEDFVPGRLQYLEIPKYMQSL